MSPTKDDPPSGSSSTPKIAIKGFSLTTKPKAGATKPTPPSKLGKRPRSTFAQHGDSESDSDSDREGFGKGESGRRNGKHEVIAGFGENGVITYGGGEREGEKGVKGPLVIPRLGNRDWKAEARARRGKNLLPEEVQARRKGSGTGKIEGKIDGVDVVNANDGEIRWGLSVRRKKVEDPGDSGDSGDRDGEGNEVREVKVVEEEVNEEGEDVPTKEKTDDEAALAALLGQKAEKKGPDLVISATTEEREDRYTAPISEEDAYRRAIREAPDVSTLEDYERVPVEEFGAALLRGMGWKGEKKEGPKEVKRRQNLLGLGAKELKDAEELGAWVQKSDVKWLKGPGTGHKGGERRPKANEYRREEEKRKERREERHGGSYRRERERERDEYRERDRDRDRRK